MKLLQQYLRMCFLFLNKLNTHVFDSVSNVTVRDIDNYVYINKTGSEMSQEDIKTICYLPGDSNVQIISISKFYKINANGVIKEKILDL